MRKNLFLTLALALVSFAGVFAQEQENKCWSITLTAQEGLPGTVATIDGAAVALYQSGVITMDQASNLIRLTVVETGTASDKVGECPYNYFTMSELSVYTPDLGRKINYKATSNAINYESSGSFQWGDQGIAALSDGKYNTFFHSDATKPTLEYHYIDILLEEEVESFIIEWAGRADYLRQAPTVVGITRDRYKFTPYTDIVFEEGEQIVTEEELAQAEYILLKGNAAEEYTVYVHTSNAQTGETAGDISISNDEPQIGLTGVGSVYVSGTGANKAKEPTHQHIIELIPAGEDGKYLIYFPNTKQYFKADNNYAIGSNQWQGTTLKPEEAAFVSVKAIDGGDFELSYMSMREGAEQEIVYIGSDPSEGKMKIINKENKEHMEQYDWCPTLGRASAFNWTIYSATYEAQDWAGPYTISQMTVKLKNLLRYVADDEEGTITGIIEELEALDTEDITREQLSAIIAENAEIASEYLGKLMIAEAKYMKNDLKAPGTDEYIGNHISETFVNGKYPADVYNETVVVLTAEAEALAEVGYDGINEIAAYFIKRDDVIQTLFKSQYKGVVYGTYGADADLPNEWEQVIEPGEAVTGFRMTITKANEGTAYGYPHVSFGTLEVLDADGNKVELTADMLSTNSLCTSEGSLANLLDESTSTYFQSIWNGDGSHGTMNPVGYVYIDVQFPEGVSLEKFTIKTNVRTPAQEGGYPQDHSRPKTVVIGKYGVAFGNSEGTETDPYDVETGDAIASVDELVDGGIYLIRGNLYKNLKKEGDEEKFNMYHGIELSILNDINDVDDSHLYMFMKNGDAWNILSLANLEFWAAPAKDANECQSKSSQAEAANIKIEASTNIAGAFVMYSELTDSVSKASYSWGVAAKEDGTFEFDSINIEEQDVNTNKLVFMDWGAGYNLQARACVDQQPGVFTYGKDVIDAHVKKDSFLLGGQGFSAGDYLHFNKTNGEGEWNIYKLSANKNADIIFLNAVVTKIEEAGLNPGTEPGCIIVNDETLAEYNAALAAAKVALENNEEASAKELAMQLLKIAEEINKGERVPFDKDAVYTIVNADPRFVEKTLYTRALYADTENSVIRWKVNPNYFASQKYQEFLFNIIPVDKRFAETNYLSSVKEADYGKAIVIKMATEDKYAGALANNELSLVNAQDGGFNVFMPEYIGEGQFRIKNYSDGQVLHANGHSQGSGMNGNMVYYGGDLNSPSAWTFVTVSQEELATEIADLVVEGAEVIAVHYFTVAGVEVAEPVKGINIVVTVYSNGVVESKKILKK